MRADFWTEERIATLKRLWAEGKSASAIAKELNAGLNSELSTGSSTGRGGVSRGAVLGKIFRLRLDASEKPAKKAGQRAKTANQKTGTAASKDRPVRRRGAEPQAAAPVRKRKSIFDLTNQCCRWPHGEPGAENFFFCGAAGADVENGLPYCPQHMRRAYIVPPDHSGAACLPTALTPWRVVSALRSQVAA